MPSAIFRRLEKPAEDYLSKAEAIVEVDSTDSSLTGMNSVSDRTSHTADQVEQRSPPPGEIPDLVSEENYPVTAFKLKPYDAEHQPTMPLAQVAKNPEDTSFCPSAILNTSSNPVTPDTSIDVHDEEKQNEGSNPARGGSGAQDPVDEESEPAISKSRVSKQKTTVKHSRRNNYHSSSRRERNRSSTTEDDDSSSDDDSSYFATHLPSPKSGRSFSISSNASNASAQGRTHVFQIQKQGSDASLSFSDESDDEHNHPNDHQETKDLIIQGAVTPEGGIHLSPVVHPNRSVVDMNLYPQRITRMHSVSSLVSSASSDNDRGMDDDSNSGEGEEANRRRSFTGDDSMTSSLPSVASSGPEGLHKNMDIATGQGGYYFHNNNLSNHPQYIHQSAGMVPMYYPQQPMTNQQMMAWTTTPPSDSELEYAYSNPTHSNMGSSRSGIQSEQSLTSLAMVYSEDDEVGVTRFKDSNALSSTSASGKQASNSGVSGGRGNGMALTGGGSGDAGGNTGSSGPSGRDLGPASQRASGDAESEAVSAANGGFGGDDAVTSTPPGRQTFKVYWQRWIMLYYMSVLNLLSDWTCYSVAPISLLTEEAFGNIDPERLVVVFLGANAIATACEPMLLARLGLRRTVLLGSLLLMIGSIVKSGGLPPIMEPSLEKGHAESSLYLGFFIVGLSQPLYQCTPALLSASWFPEEERTMATGVALNANQLGIGFAFIFGTLLVSRADDIPSYFGLLSQIATLCFIGTLIQFDDAPPTPPSASARVMKGNLNFKIPQFANRQFRRYFSRDLSEKKPEAQAPSPAASNLPLKDEKEKHKRSSKSKKSGRSSSGGKRVGSARRRNQAPKFQTANAENGLSAPSNAHYGSTREAMKDLARANSEFESLLPQSYAPSPAPMSGRPTDSGGRGSPNQEDTSPESAPGFNAHLNPTGQMPMGPGGPQGAFPPGQMPMHGAYPYGYPPGGYQYYPYYTPEQMEQQQQQAYLQQMYYQHQMPPQPMGAQGMPPQINYLPPPSFAMPMFSYQHNFSPPLGEFDPRSDAYDITAYGDDGAEPRVTVTNNHLDIDIRDDQVVRSLHACMIRQGFSHALAAFTVSGIVINTLSTYMDYLVRLNGAPRSYTGIVGGTFQFAIMASSLIMGKQTDKTRAYYSVTTGMLVLGAFGLAECGVSLDSNRGSDLRWSLLLVAVLVGPLQPISTELGVEVAYPLSENTVLVIQQLFSNLLSALFIPFFKSLKDIGTSAIEDGEIVERPEYTFSFYLLIVLHTLVTVYFATFNGKYLRYEHELQKKEEEEAEYGVRGEEQPSHPTYPDQAHSFSQQYSNQGGEQQPLMSYNT
mmetsp:Transcript_11958/g.34263  ORF Transcript_11958/g.34263 Transcript_11958/m.34263 type:complete len:1330 (-) Transcript_11958:135-4124(-)